MASSLWKSFVEAVVPKCEEPACAEDVTHNHMVGGHPWSCCKPQSAHAQEMAPWLLWNTEGSLLTLMWAS